MAVSLPIAAMSPSSNTSMRLPMPRFNSICFSLTGSIGPWTILETSAQVTVTAPLASVGVTSATPPWAEVKTPLMELPSRFAIVMPPPT